jgi:hypothetical protein
MQVLLAHLSNLRANVSITSLTRSVNNMYITAHRMTVPPFTRLPLPTSNLLAVDGNQGFSKLQATEWSRVCSLLPFIIDALGDAEATLAFAMCEHPLQTVKVLLLRCTSEMLVLWVDMPGIAFDNTAPLLGVPTQDICEVNTLIGAGLTMLVTWQPEQHYQKTAGQTWRFRCSKNSWIPLGGHV